MTQSEKILTQLAATGGSLTANQLTEATGIPKRSLATAVWELRREGLVDVVGGRRGSYEYGLTPRGRATVAVRLDGGVTGSGASRDGGGDASGLEELKRAFSSATEIRVLHQFIRWLSREHGDLLTGQDERDNQKRLGRAAFEYLGLDPDKVKEQLDALDNLVPNPL